MRTKRHLTIDEKRDWLAGIFRDESGGVSQADKFKAMAEDTRLALLESEPLPGVDRLGGKLPPHQNAQAQDA